MQIAVSVQYDRSSEFHGRTMLSIMGILAPMGRLIDDKLVARLDEQARVKGLNGRFGYGDSGKTLLFCPDDIRAYPGNIRLLLDVLSYAFVRQAVQYEVSQGGDEHVIELDGTSWQCFSSASGLRYDGPNDLLGWYPE